LYALGIDVREKWMRCRLMPLLLFHLPFDLRSTTLARRTSNCASVQWYWARWGSTARGKNVIRILERFEYHEPAWAKRSSQEKRGSDECAQARQITRAKSWRLWHSATSATSR
jgi:hypothetical protein